MMEVRPPGELGQQIESVTMIHIVASITDAPSPPPPMPPPSPSPDPPPVPPPPLPPGASLVHSLVLGMRLRGNLSTINTTQTNLLIASYLGITPNLIEIEFWNNNTMGTMPMQQPPSQAQPPHGGGGSGGGGYDPMNCGPSGMDPCNTNTGGGGMPGGGGMGGGTGTDPYNCGQSGMDCCFCGTGGGTGGNTGGNMGGGTGGGTGLMNAGLDCWNGCNMMQGSCPGFCGSQGACCSMNFAGSPPECGSGSLGCQGGHCCTQSANTGGNTGGGMPGGGTGGNTGGGMPAGRRLQFDPMNCGPFGTDPCNTGGGGMGGYDPMNCGPSGMDPCNTGGGGMGGGGYDPMNCACNTGGGMGGGMGGGGYDPMNCGPFGTDPCNTGRRLQFDPMNCGPFGTDPCNTGGGGMGGGGYDPMNCACNTGGTDPFFYDGPTIDIRITVRFPTADAAHAAAHMLQQPPSFELSQIVLSVAMVHIVASITDAPSPPPPGPPPSPTPLPPPDPPPPMPPGASLVHSLVLAMRLRGNLSTINTTDVNIRIASYLGITPNLLEVQLWDNITMGTMPTQQPHGGGGHGGGMDPMNCACNTGGGMGGNTGGGMPGGGANWGRQLQFDPMNCGPFGTDPCNTGGGGMGGTDPMNCGPSGMDPCNTGGGGTDPMNCACNTGGGMGGGGMGGGGYDPMNCGPSGMDPCNTGTGGGMGGMPGGGANWGRRLQFDPMNCGPFGTDPCNTGGGGMGGYDPMNCGPSGMDPCNTGTGGGGFDPMNCGPSGMDPCNTGGGMGGSFYDGPTLDIRITVRFPTADEAHAAAQMLQPPPYELAQLVDSVVMVEIVASITDAPSPPPPGPPPSPFPQPPPDPPPPMPPGSSLVHELVLGMRVRGNQTTINTTRFMYEFAELPRHNRESDRHRDVEFDGRWSDTEDANRRRRWRQRSDELRLQYGRRRWHGRWRYGR